ncbi:serine/threonine-protein kinase PpkA [Thermoflexales bacterium]|nr:serine/threonine-protein kinase PpkA [Thermoflexales bacterium]
MTDPLIGKTLNQFEILEAIGQGGMAMVYQARQPAMNRIVALKVLSTPMAVNPTFLARFKQEAQMIASLEHAHILPVFDMGEQEGWIFIAMRYMSHGTLTSRIAQGPVPLKDVGKWIEQIGSALDYAHQRGVVHRDVKPSNVLLDAQGNAFLADFGIAKWSEGSLDLTGSGVIGTPQYMSPEQGQGLKIDGRSDEYSLAVLAYEMIVGRPPFEAETPFAIVLKHITEPLTPPILINPRVPQAVSDVISRALSKDPNERYPTTLVFAQALSAAIVAEPIGGTLPLPQAAPTEAIHITKHEPATAPRRFRPIGIVAALAVLLTLGIGVMLILSANRPPPDRPVATIGLGPNVIVQTPTPGATPTSAAVITDTSTLKADRCTPPLLADTFDDPNSGLPRGEQSDTRWGYVDGAYQLFINVANRMQTRLIGPLLDEYDATIEAHFGSNNLGSYGLVAAARNLNDYYALTIDGDQRYAIIRRTPAGTQAIRDWLFSPALNAGQEVNRLRVVQRGNKVAFYANDVLLKIVQDEGDPAVKRSIGLTAASFALGTDARFDNLRVCPPPAEFAVRQVTLLDAFDDNRNGWAPQQFEASGGSTIENGQFTFESLSTQVPYVVLNWNPNVAFNALDLRVDAQIVSGTPASQAGVLFGLQDFYNYFWFGITNDGRYHLYRQQEGKSSLVAQGASPLIHTDLALNQIHLSVISNTLSIAVNDRLITQAAIDYTPGYIGLWCEAYQPGRTLCAFDNLHAVGTPSDSLLYIYPFCNCRRTVYGAQPLEVRWRWGAKTPGYLDQFRAGTTLTATVDGVLVENPQQYWTVPQARPDEAEMFWIYDLPSLEPGAHVIEFVVRSDTKLTDGMDENGDSQLDTYGPGDIYVGYVEVVVLP